MGEALRRRRRALRVMHRLVASDIALKDFRRPVRTSTWSIASKSARAARAPRVADGALASRVMALEPVMATLSELLQATAVARLRAVSAAAREAVRASARLRLTWSAARVERGRRTAEFGAHRGRPRASGVPPWTCASRSRRARLASAILGNFGAVIALDLAGGNLGNACGLRDARAWLSHASVGRFLVDLGLENVGGLADCSALAPCGALRRLRIVECAEGAALERVQTLADDCPRLETVSLVLASMRACGSLAQLARLRALRVLDLRFECAYFLEFLFAHADPLAGEWLLGHAAADASYAQLDAVMAGAHARAPTLDLRPFAQCARLARVLVGGCEKDGQTFPDVSTLGELRQRRPEIRADWRVLHHWVD